MLEEVNRFRYYSTENFIELSYLICTNFKLLTIDIFWHVGFLDLEGSICWYILSTYQSFYLCCCVYWYSKSSANVIHSSWQITYGDPSVRIPHLNQAGCNWEIILYIIREYRNLLSPSLILICVYDVMAKMWCFYLLSHFSIIFCFLPLWIFLKKTMVWRMLAKYCTDFFTCFFISLFLTFRSWSFLSLNI